MQELRMQLAAQILSGLLANSNVVARDAEVGWDLVNSSQTSLARYAVMFADAVINDVETNEPFYGR